MNMLARFVTSLISMCFVGNFACALDFQDYSTKLDSPSLSKNIFAFSPTLLQGRSSFVYMVDGLGFEKTVMLAELTSISGKPEAKIKQQLFYTPGYSGNASEFVRIPKVSPDNRYVVVPVDQIALDFADYNYNFFDMNTGKFLKFVNEHNIAPLFSVLTHSSVMLESTRTTYLTLGYPSEYVASFYYIVDPDSYVDTVKSNWNSDGTFSITYDLLVKVMDNTEDLMNEGSEALTLNFSVDSAGVTVESYGDVKSLANYPLTFPVTLIGGRPAIFDAVISMQPKQVFRTKTSRINSSLISNTTSVEANIPALYSQF